MPTAKVFSALVVVALAACRIGTGGGDLAVAKEPGGARVFLGVSRGAFSGELLAVHDDGIMFSNDRTVMFAPFPAITYLNVDKLGRDFVLRPAEIPSGGRLARFRAVSRFPQGITPSIQSVLLAQKSQTQIEVLQ